jgi:hypothetical protein
MSINAQINWTEIMNDDMFDFVMDVKRWKMDIIVWNDIAYKHFDLFEEKLTPLQEAKRRLLEQLVDGDKYDLAKADFDDYDDYWVKLEGGYEFPSNQLCRHCEEKPITRGESLCRSCF